MNRRNFLRRAAVTGAMATAGTMVVSAPARAASTSSSSSTLALGDYGAVGDGSTDDTAAIQSALNAATDGMTVLGDPSATYLITSTLTFPADGVTLDLNGAGVLIGAQRASGSELATNDTVFACLNRSGVRITGGTMLPPASAFTGSLMPFRIQIVGGDGCRVDSMSADCEGSAFAFVNGPGHQIDHNTIQNGSITGWSTTDLTIEANTLQDSPSDAISVIGFQGGPCSGTQYLNNVITGYGRIGIEDYCPDGPALSQSPVFSGNQISAPSAANTSGTGISAMATNAVISNNTITDARGWGIEANGLGTTITNNTLSWSSPSTAVLETMAIVVNTSEPDQLAPVLVHANTISGPGYGIFMYGDCFYCPVTIAANTVTNVLRSGINLAPAQTAGGVALLNNNVAFTSGPWDSTNRIGITSQTNCLLQGNDVTFSAESYEANVDDTPYFLVGDNVTMLSNVSDGGGRTDGHVLSWSVGGNYTGWIMSANQFINGATVDLGGITMAASSSQSASGADSTGSSAQSASGADSTGSSAQSASGADSTGSSAQSASSAPSTGSSAQSASSAPSTGTPETALSQVPTAPTPPTSTGAQVPTALLDAISSANRTRTSARQTATRHAATLHAKTGRRHQRAGRHHPQPRRHTR